LPIIYPDLRLDYKVATHPFGRSFEHYIRLALAGEAAKVNSFPGHLLKAFMNGRS
jgi:hypothetical protein